MDTLHRKNEHLRLTIVKNKEREDLDMKELLIKAKDTVTSIPASCKALTISLNSWEALRGPPPELA